MKHGALLLALALGLAVLPAAAPAWAQDILTADQFFSQVADRYAQVADYEGRINIAAGKDVMSGVIAYKAPSLLRIDFVQPPDQVIAFDGQRLVVYIPSLRAVLQQQAAGKPGAGSAGLATREGLKMMKRNYTVAYEASPAAEPLDAATPEPVVRLSLNRKSVAEGFRTMRLSVSPETKLIRRIEGTTVSGERFVFDFVGIKLNQGIPEARFIYDSPASANVYNNFLFGSDN